jgi:hypothetical protein
MKLLVLDAPLVANAPLAAPAPHQRDRRRACIFVVGEIRRGELDVTGEKSRSRNQAARGGHDLAGPSGRFMVYSTSKFHGLIRRNLTPGNNSYLVGGGYAVSAETTS